MMALFLLVLTFSTAIFSCIDFEYYSYAGVVSAEIYDVGYIDCWTNSAGVWIWGADHAGNPIHPIPKYAGGGSVSYTFKRSVPPQFVGKITGIKSIEYDHNNENLPYAIKEEYIQIQPSYSFGDTYIEFQVELVYLESNEYEGMGRNIREDWQAPLVQGRRFYMPIIIHLEYENHLDTIVAKYQDENGGTLKPDDKYNPENEGYFTVYAAEIDNYELISNSQASFWISQEGIEHVAVFVYRSTGGDPPDPGGGGEEGNVTITFSPDSTQAIGGKTRDNNSYWVNQDIPVTVSATGEITMTNTASRSYSYTYQWEEVIPPNPDGTGGGTVTRTGTGSGSEQQEYTEKFTPARLKIAGTAGVDTTIPNGSNVTITKEEKNMKLTAQVAGWNRGAREWIETGEPNPSPPQGTVVSARWTGGQPPTGPEPTDTFPAESGHYSLDKTPPVIRINYSPQKDWWSNSDFHITIQADDQSQQGAANVSGMNNSHIDITNNSYTGNKPYMGKRDIPHSHSSSYSYSQSITINQDGLYQIPITLQDLAGNKGIIEINGRTVTTNGTWTEGDLPLDKTNPEPARFSMTPNNPFGATKTIDRVPVKPPAYTVSQEPPGFEYTLDQNQNKIQIHLDDNLSGIGSHGQYNSHTDSSRLQYAWSKSHQQLTEPGGWQNYHQHYSSTNSLLREHIQPRWNPPDYTQHLGRSTQILDPHLGSPQYSQQKEGLWYLHIKQTDRAGNQTITVSPPIYINKIKNLRIIGIADYKWEAIFQNHNRQPTPLQYQGIRTREFPIYTNRWGHGTALGYQTRYKIDTIGYEDPQDQIQIQVQYHALDNQRNLYKNVDIYLLNKAGKYVRIDDINNPQWDEQVQYYYQQSRNIILRPQNKEAIPYEADREEGSQQRIRHSQDQAKEKYNTYESHLFLPYHAKFVRRGYPLDLFQKRGLQEYQVLITFQVTGKKGHQAIAELDYTQKEDQWAKDNKWHQSPPTEYNSYGKNRPTNADLLGKGINKGEVIWWDLYRTIQDDFQLNRYW
ncbi:hypothetical protein [Alkaliphilus crotonatoxidans]